MSDLREMRIQYLARPDTEEGADERLLAKINLLMTARDMTSNRDKLIKESRCPLCHIQISPLDFRGKGESSLDEYYLSGLCPSCQDDVFAEDTEE